MSKCEEKEMVSKMKAKIVLEGLSGEPVSEICNEYVIYQHQYYSGRDKFLSDAHNIFESKKGKGSEMERLLREKNELK